MRRIPELDGLRGVSALTVAFSHATIWTLERTGHPMPPLTAFFRAAADLAVIVFFVLSGLVIGINEQALHSRGAVAGYALRRITRIYPIYVLGLVAGFSVVAAPLLSKEFLADGGFLQMWLTPFPPGNAALWSLHYEAVFYALFPIVVFLNFKPLPLAITLALVSMLMLFSSAHLLVICGYFSLWLLGLWLAQFSQSNSSDRPVIGPMALLLLAYFAANPVGAMLSKSAPPMTNAVGLPHPLSAVAIGFPVAALVAASFGLGRRYLWIATLMMFAVVGATLVGVVLRHLLWMPSYQAACAAVLAATLIAVTRWRIDLSARTMVWFGDVSYALYVFHTPVILCALLLVPRKSPWPFYVIAVVVALPISILLAWIAEKLLQPRISRWVRRTWPIARHARPVQPATAELA